MKSIRRILGLLFVGLFLSATCAANETLKQIQSAVHQHLEDGLKPYQQRNPDARIEIKVNPLDPRIRLSVCQQALSIENKPSKHEGGRKSIRVDCPDNKPWGIYVSADITIYRHVATATELINRGDTVDPHNTDFIEQDVSKLRRGFFVDYSQFEQHEAKRTIQAGHAINAGMLNAIKVIRKGDSVTIEAKSANLTVKMSGTALSDGRLGQNIRVRNNSSQRTIQATVSAEKQVTIRL